MFFTFAKCVLLKLGPLLILHERERGHAAHLMVLPYDLYLPDVDLYKKNEQVASPCISSEVTFLSLFPGLISKAKNLFLFFLSFGARMVIPRHWIPNLPPSFRKSITKITHLWQREELTTWQISSSMHLHLEYLDQLYELWRLQKSSVTLLVTIP